MAHIMNALIVNHARFTCLRHKPEEICSLTNCEYLHKSSEPNVWKSSFSFAHSKPNEDRVNNTSLFIPNPTVLSEQFDLLKQSICDLENFPPCSFLHWFLLILFTEYSATDCPSSAKSYCLKSFIPLFSEQSFVILILEMLSDGQFVLIRAMSCTFDSLDGSYLGWIITSGDLSLSPNESLFLFDRAMLIFTLVLAGPAEHLSKHLAAVTMKPSAT